MKVDFSVFELKVLKEVSKVPLGQVRSYKWLAQKIRKPKAVRAVGQVLKKNPFPLIIPCHRIIRSDGKIGGYSRGIRRKIFLLKLEKELTKILNATSHSR